MGVGVCSDSRGMGVKNFLAPNSGLGGVPVGTPSAKALGASGLKPFLHTRMPPLVMMPHLMRSRRLIWPRERARWISARLSRALWASLSRMREDFGDKNIGSASVKDVVAPNFLPPESKCAISGETAPKARSLAARWGANKAF